jgi:transcriptional regulator with XRE-family HTH domain
MMWMARIGECVKAAMLEAGLSRDDVAQAADGVSKDTVDSVRNGSLSVSAKNVERVVRALGLQIVVDCVPATLDWQANKDHLVATLREKSGMKLDAKGAEKLLHVCEMLIKSGEAREAVDVLMKWQAGGDIPRRNVSGGGGHPLA